MNKLIALLPALAALSIACGGGNTEAATPEASAAPVTSASAAAASDMPPPAASSVATAPAAPPPPQPADDLKIVPMKFVVNAAKGEIWELKADGTLNVKGKPIATVSKNEVAIADAGVKIDVWKDNSITITGVTKKINFDDKDAMVGEDGGKISVDDKGKVTATMADGKPEKSVPTIQGFKPDGRRVADIVVSMYIYQQKMAAPATTPAVATPAGKPASGK